MSSTEPTTRSGLQPARENRVLALEDVEWRKSGSGDGQLTVRGHAAVFNRLSLDLGGFQERIAPGAFTNVLDKSPDVHAVWDHDTKFVLARTRNKTLELREDPAGLHFWAKVAPTTYAADLRVLMERGDVDQASFAFTVARDEWTTDENDNVTRTILEVGELYDVTITAQGAYPQSDAQVVAQMRSRVKAEIAEGRLPAEAAGILPEIVAPDEPVDVTEPQNEVLDPVEERNPAPETVEDTSAQEAEEKRAEELKALKTHTRQALELTKRRLLDAERERER